ncbi:MAG TPA: glucose-6-phosphate dehydrogenase assembly protein OpcA [Candidatus Acidoferrales bacterium]|nr:glucose-6-phosphate dehydrogenase assembly protein OpcA [Candidatus Acidoferrales bacterium]
MTPPKDGMPVAPMKGLTAVAVANIEAALAERRRVMVSKLEHPHSRACVMTLIVGIQETTDNQPALDVVSQLAGKYPIRVIAVGSAAMADNSLTAWVNTACEGVDSVSICTEEIVLQGSADSTDRVLSAVRGTLVSDLPVMLWWRGGAPAGDALWSGLFAMSDRAIVDSHRFALGFRASGGASVTGGHGPAAIKALRGIVRAGGSRASVRDLNWQRTAPWRAAIATCFDDREVLALLPDIDRCSITFSGEGDDDPPSARALLMAGWLRNRLPRLRESCVVAPGKRSAGIDPGRIVGIALTSSGNKASLLLVRKSAPTSIEAQASSPDGKSFRRWSFGASTLTEAQLLDGCLETLGRDSMFEASLEYAAP